MRQMNLRARWGAALAAVVMVAGCNLSPEQVKDIAKKALSVAQSDTGRAIASQMAANLQQYVDIEAGQTLADTVQSLNFDGISYGTQALHGDKLDDAKKKVEDALKNKFGSGNMSDAAKKIEFAKNLKDKAKPAIDSMRKQVAKRVDARVGKIKEKFDPSRDLQTKSGTASIDPWGEVTIVSATMSLKVKDASKTHVFDRYYDANKVLVWVVDHTEHLFKNGARHVADRDRMNFDDGSYKVTYKATTTGPKGKTRSVEWAREGSADGSETGTGTITRFDGTSTDLTFTKDASGKTVASTTDAATKTKVEVSQTEGDTEAKVVVTDTQEPSKTITEVLDTENLEPSDQ